MKPLQRAVLTQNPANRRAGGVARPGRVTIPLAPRTARAIGLAVGERTEGPLFATADGKRLDRHGAPPGRPPSDPTRRDHQTRQPTHPAARVYHRRPGYRSAPAGRAGGHLPTLTCAPRCAMTGRAPAWTGMPSTSLPRSSQEPRGGPLVSSCPTAAAGQIERWVRKPQRMKRQTASRHHPTGVLAR